MYSKNLTNFHFFKGVKELGKILISCQHKNGKKLRKRKV